MARLAAGPHMPGPPEPRSCFAVWRQRLCGDDAVPRRGLDRGVIGLFGLGASSYRPRHSRIVVYPESRGAPKWGNGRMFHSSIIHRPTARGVCFRLSPDPF